MVRANQGFTFEQLMEGCAGFSDCAFEILDALPIFAKNRLVSDGEG